MTDEDKPIIGGAAVMTSAGACIACYAAEVALVAMLLGTGVHLLGQIEPITRVAGTACLTVGLLITLTWSCRYTLGRRERASDGRP